MSELGPRVAQSFEMSVLEELPSAFVVLGCPYVFLTGEAYFASSSRYFATRMPMNMDSGRKVAP